MKQRVSLLLLTLFLAVAPAAKAYAYVHMLRPDGTQNTQEQPLDKPDWIGWPEWIG